MRSGRRREVGCRVRRMFPWTKRGLKAGLVWVKVAVEGCEDGEEVEGGEEVAARRGRAVDGEVEVEEGEKEEEWEGLEWGC